MTDKVEMEQQGAEGARLYQSAGPLTHVENHSYYASSNTINYAKLADEYKKEIRNNTLINDIAGKLLHFTTSIDTEFIGLEQKLINGGFESELQFAALLKEQYTKYLIANNLSKVGQKIHSFLLARIFVAFNMYIPDAIKEGRSRQEIKEIIIERIVQPVEDTLGVDNVLDLYQDDVMAMVYFLTGNCHIKWE
jgi:trehalose/maltose hydrolase-like predicted phosphorylase